MHYSFRFARCSRCVENVEGIVGFHGQRLHVISCIFVQFMMPEVSSFLHVDVNVCSFHHYDAFHRGALFEGSVRNFL